MPTNSETCMIEGCNRTIHCRGLCQRCFGAARYRVDTGRVTWEQLVSLRCCRPRKYASLFASQFDKALADKSRGGTP